MEVAVIELLAGVSAVLLLAVLVLLVVLVKSRPSPGGFDRDGMQVAVDRLESRLREELTRTREESLQVGDRLRIGLNQQGAGMTTQVGESLRAFGAQFAETSRLIAGEQQKQMDQMRSTVETNLKEIREDSRKRLEEIRVMVDQKLQQTLETRLGESFRTVSEQLQQVHKGLGEMQTLASGVGDLKRVLQNVKVRGMWGEAQLGNLLEQMLAPGQYEKNVATRPGSSERVEFAIRLPGQDVDGTVWLPIDAKFPLGDYERLVDASDAGNPEAVEVSRKQLETRIKACARDIHDKYLDPPNTTSMAILYLPVEGLYAEVVRLPGLMDTLQRDFQVSVAGPSTLAALLAALQMGFKTLAIEKRSQEIWKVLGAVKTEFGKFGVAFDRVRRKIEEAGRTLDDSERRKRAMDKKLRDVETLPEPDAAGILALDETDMDLDIESEPDEA
jgi:DNA recombination protein RmuC